MLKGRNMPNIETCKIKDNDSKIDFVLRKNLPDQEKFQLLANLFSVFSDAMRVKLMYLLLQKELCVCDISEILNATQSNISHHLAILKDHNLVGFRKEGKKVIYFLKDDHVKKIIQMGFEHILER